MRFTQWTRANYRGSSRRRRRKWIFMTRVCIEVCCISNCLGVSEQLKQLLATLHEEDPLVLADSSRATGLSAAAQEFVPGKPFSATSVPEFVPGKTFVMERERSEAGSTGGAGLNTEAPAFVPSWQKSSATSTPSATASMTAAVTAATVAAASVSEKKVWWYRDPQGVVRGPFSTTEMRAWSEKGYFSGGLEVALSDRGPYLPLSSVYPSPERPFWKSMEPREFASRMRTHILSTRSAMTMSAATD